jgi:hypothetical protein
MDRFAVLKNRLKEIALTSKLLSHPFTEKEKVPTPQEPEK